MAKRRTKTSAPGIYKSNSGRYEIQFRDSGGRSVFQVVDGNFADAKAARAEVLDKLRKGANVRPSKHTFEVFAAEWLAVQHQLRPRTLEVYEIAIRLHLNPVLGERKLSEISETEILRVISTMQRQGLAPWTIRSVLTPLGRILSHAVRRGLISSNPMQRLERGERPTVERREMRILSREQIGQLLDAAPARIGR